MYNFLEKVISRPGDIIEISGIFLPRKKENFRKTGELDWYLGSLYEMITNFYLQYY